jgi:hypothetical protein
MKQLLLAAALSLAATAAQAQYTGTGSNPNSSQRDNYSATGNVNPYTGVVGTRNPKY